MSTIGIYNSRRSKPPVNFTKQYRSQLRRPLFVLTNYSTLAYHAGLSLGGAVCLWGSPAISPSCLAFLVV